MRVSGFRGGNDLLIGGVLVAVAEVFHDGAVEQPAILQDHSVAPPQRVAAHVADIDAVEQDAALVDLIEAHEQIDQRRFAAARGTDDRDVTAARNAEREVPDQRLFGHIGEADVPDFHIAADVFGISDFVVVGAFVLGFEYGKDALGSGKSRLQLCQHARDLIEGLGVLVGVGEEAGETADAETSRNDRQRADDRDGGVDERVDEACAGVRESARELRLEANVVKLLVELFKVLAGAFLIGERLDDPLVADVLLDIGGDVSLQELLFGEALVSQLADERREEERQRGEHEHDDRDAPVDREHENQRADDGDDAGEQLQTNLRQTVADRVDVVDDAADQVAVRVGVDIGKRYGVELAEHVASQVAHDAEADDVDEIIHQPLTGGNADDRGGDIQNDTDDRLKVDLALCDDVVDRLSDEDGNQQGEGDADDRAEQRENQQAAVRRQAMDQFGYGRIFHFFTSASLSWDRQMSRYVSQVSNNSSCRPAPASLPSLRTRIKSAFLMVEQRWVTISTVMPWVFSRSA